MLDVTEGPIRPACYLVVNASLIVGTDIAEIVQEYEPRARVLLFDMLDPALEALDGQVRCGPLPRGNSMNCTALIDAPVDEFARHPLSACLSAAGWRIILTGADSESAPALGWERIELPFDTAGLKAVLGRYSSACRHFM